MCIAIPNFGLGNRATLITALKTIATTLTALKTSATLTMLTQTSSETRWVICLLIPGDSKPRYIISLPASSTAVYKPLIWYPKNKRKIIGFTSPFTVATRPR